MDVVANNVPETVDARGSREDGPRVINRRVARCSRIARGRQPEAGQHHAGEAGTELLSAPRAE